MNAPDHLLKTSKNACINGGIHTCNKAQQKYQKLTISNGEVEVVHGHKGPPALANIAQLNFRYLDSLNPDCIRLQNQRGWEKFVRQEFFAYVCKMVFTESQMEC